MSNGIRMEWTIITNKPSTQQDTLLQDRGVCEVCKVNTATFLIQSPDGHVEKMICDTCYEKLVEKRQDIRETWIKYPVTS